MSAKNEHGLTPQREKFAQVVASGKSQSDAYRAAFKAEKMTAKQIHEEASKLAADPKVSQRVAVLARKVEEVFAIDTAKLLREASRIAHSDIRKIIGPKGTVLLPHELDEDTSAAVSSFKIDEYGRIEYKFWDKNSAHERLFKHRGLFEIDNKQKTDPLAEVLKGLGGNVAGVVKDAP